MKQIGLGGMLFAELREGGYYYVDKTLLIRDILGGDPRGVYLFARPRRFGKTLNISMLDAFFNIEYKGNTWFDGLAISECPECVEYMNRFPVIRLNLSGTKMDTYDAYLDKIRLAVKDAYRPHMHLLECEGLDATVRMIFESLDRMDTRETLLSSSIQELSGAIAKATGTKPIILIDEYDAAATYSYGKESHEKILKFLRDLLEASVKTNEHRQMAYMTGVMQIAKQSIFSGLNNVTVNNIFSERSDERFGFTADEVRAILEYYGNPKKYREAKKWYDGYRFGNAEVYNPYSIMSYVSKGFEADNYWVDSGSNVLIRRLIRSIEDDTYADALALIAGGTVETEIDSKLAYGNLDVSGKTLYSLMAISGYLKAVPTRKKGVFKVSMPNEEVRDAAARLIREAYPISDSDFNGFNRAVLNGDADTMTAVLQKVMLQSSYMSLAESTYQAVIMTIMHGLSKHYDVRTESEEGNGRVDIILKSRSKGRKNMIFELKVADSEKKLDSEADDAIRQIHRKRYYLGMPGDVVLVGLAFWVKVPRGRIEIIDNGPDGTAMLGKPYRGQLCRCRAPRAPVPAISSFHIAPSRLLLRPAEAGVHVGGIHLREKYHVGGILGMGAQLHLEPGDIVPCPGFVSCLEEPPGLLEPQRAMERFAGTVGHGDACEHVDHALQLQDVQEGAVQGMGAAHAAMALVDVDGELRAPPVRPAAHEPVGIGVSDDVPGIVGAHDPRVLGLRGHDPAREILHGRELQLEGDRCADALPVDREHRRRVRRACHPQLHGPLQDGACI